MKSTQLLIRQKGKPTAKRLGASLQGGSGFFHFAALVVSSWGLPLTTGSLGQDYFHGYDGYLFIIRNDALRGRGGWGSRSGIEENLEKWAKPKVKMSNVKI